MYLAKVLVGRYCVGNSSMIVPPPKNPSKPEILYDSVVNNQSSPMGVKELTPSLFFIL